MLSKLLSQLFQTENQFPHGLGCGCRECQERRRQRRYEIDARIKAGKEPETLLEMLVAARRRKQGTH